MVTFSLQGTSVITPIIPITMVVAPGLVIATNSSEQVFEASPILFILTWGIMAAKVTNKLIVAHMSKSELSNNDVVLLVPLAFLLRSYCNLDSVISEKHLLVAACAFVCVDLFLYSRAVCAEICQHMKVRDLVTSEPHYINHFLQVELFRIPLPAETTTKKNK